MAAKYYPGLARIKRRASATLLELVTLDVTLIQVFVRYSEYEFTVRKPQLVCKI
jgi:hypothetical protein